MKFLGWEKRGMFWGKKYRLKNGDIRTTHKLESRLTNPERKEIAK